MTLDEVIARNVTRLRKAKEWTMPTLARKLEVTRHDVLAYEGRRHDRPQRPFRWSELVELCYIFGVTLYELVLPADSDSGVDVGETALGGLLARDVAIGMPRREDLGLGLFGVSGDELFKQGVLKMFANAAREAGEKRAEILQAVNAGILEAMQVAREIAKLRPGMTFQDLVKMEEELYPNQTLEEILQSIRDEGTQE